MPIMMSLLQSFQNFRMKMRNKMKMNTLLSPNTLITSSLHVHHRMATNKQYLLSRKLKTKLNVLMRQELWCLLEDAQ